MLRPSAPKIDPALTDDAIRGMTIGDMKVLIEPFGGVAGLLEKRDFFERLQELRDRSRDLQNGTVAPPKVVAAPTPNVPSAKDVMPIDPNWTDHVIEAMSLAEIKEILKYHGGHSGFVEKVEYISRLKELVAGERAAIEAVQSEMTRDQQEQAEQRMNAGR